MTKYTFKEYVDYDEYTHLDEDGILDSVRKGFLKVEIPDDINVIERLVYFDEGSFRLKAYRSRLIFEMTIEPRNRKENDEISTFYKTFLRGNPISYLIQYDLNKLVKNSVYSKPLDELRYRISALNAQVEKYNGSTILRYFKSIDYASRLEKMIDAIREYYEENSHFISMRRNEYIKVNMIKYLNLALQSLRNKSFTFIHDKNNPEKVEEIFLQGECPNSILISKYDVSYSELIEYLKKSIGAYGPVQTIEKIHF